MYLYYRLITSIEPENVDIFMNESSVFYQNILVVSCFQLPIPYDLPKFQTLHVNSNISLSYRQVNMHLTNPHVLLHTK